MSIFTLYTFFASLFGIIFLISLKAWELHRGAKPFSVLRYRLDILARRSIENFKTHYRYVSWTTLRITLAFLVAKFTDVVTLLWQKIKNSEVFQLIRGTVIPKASGPVSAFLKDVAEFKTTGSLSGQEIKKESEKEIKEDKVINQKN